MESRAFRLHPFRPRFAWRWILVASALCAATASADMVRGAVDVETLDRAQRRMVKIFGAGGFRGLEAFQSGFLVSAEGHVLTAFSHVLDTDEIVVLLDDGSRYVGEIVAADPRLEAAVLKIDVEGAAHFDLTTAGDVDVMSRVLAISNLFGIATGDEPMSVQQGVVVMQGPLAARRGVFDVSYDGAVYVLDAMTSNPGAAGGAVTDLEGRLVGMIGKPLRNAGNHTLVNYAIPTAALGEFVDRARRGVIATNTEKDFDVAGAERHTLDGLGIVLVPDVVERTPPYVDAVRRDSAAAEAGLVVDDLIVFFEGELVPSCAALAELIQRVDRGDAVSMSVMRGGELVEMTIQGE